MELPDFGLDDQVAIVTGASRGIGYGVAKSLAAAGATVAVSARDEASLATLVSEIREDGGKAAVFPLDVTDVAQIGEVFQSVRDQFGQLDIVVNNAGLGAGHAAIEVTESDWDQMMDVNLKGLFFCCQAAGRIMLPQRAGRIINMSSQASVVGIRNSAVYCASKGGVNQLTKVLALEWSGRGVTVNAVGPTFIYTPGTAERLDSQSFATRSWRGFRPADSEPSMTLQVRSSTLHHQLPHWCPVRCCSLTELGPRNRSRLPPIDRPNSTLSSVVMTWGCLDELVLIVAFSKQQNQIGRVKDAVQIPISSAIVAGNPFRTNQPAT